MWRVLEFLGPAADAIAVVGFVGGALAAGAKFMIAWYRRRLAGRPPRQPVPPPPSSTGAARCLFFGVCALVLALAATVARATISWQNVYVFLQLAVLPLATAAGFYGVSGLYRAKQNKRADPMLYSGAGLVAAMSAVADLILSNDM
jgi:hypothetical protein